MSKRVDVDHLSITEMRMYDQDYSTIIGLLQDNYFVHQPAVPPLRDKNNNKIIEMWKTDSIQFCEKVFVCRTGKYVLLSIAGTFYTSTKEIKMSFERFIKTHT